MYRATSWYMYYLPLHVRGYLIIMHVHVQCTYTGLHVQGYFMVHVLPPLACTGLLDYNACTCTCTGLLHGTCTTSTCMYRAT